MVNKESRDIFQLSASTGRSWKNIERAHDETERAKADLLALLKREVGERFASEDSNLIVFGSLGRGEWIDWISDLDWTFLIDGQCKPLHFDIAQDIREALKKEQRTGVAGNPEYRFAAPGPTGTFGNLGFSHQLIHLIGGQEDTNKNTTQRILLLLESVSIGDSSAHERVKGEIVQRYLEEEPYLVERSGSRFKVPRFLLNDIVRFWRTMAVDFASKQRDRRGEGWGLRNAKLRMSRKLIFVSGLLTCFSCQLDNDLQSKTADDATGQDVARNRHLAYLQNHILQQISRTPLDILARAAKQYRVESSTAEALFSSYDDFLGVVGDASKRESLKRLKAEDARQDPVFGEVREISERFSAALDRIFFENTLLADLTRRYGVF
ncbi:MAG: hypothetical protein WCF26_28965 [Candidatus Sulfotelmatobacter sp.]